MSEEIAKRSQKEISKALNKGILQAFLVFFAGAGLVKLAVRLVLTAGWYHSSGL